MRMFLILLVLSGPVVYGIPKPVHPFAPQGKIVYPTPEEFLAVNNQLRAERQLLPMQSDPKLMVLAENYAKTCRHVGFISHYHYGRLEDRLGSIDYKWRASEEILVGGPQMLGRDPFASWKDSPKHYESILGNCTHCGFGVAYDSRGYGYWVGVFATPAKVSTGN